MRAEGASSQSDESGKPNLISDVANAFILSTDTICESVVRGKAEVLRNQRWSWASLSGIIGLIPIPGVSLTCDAAIIVENAVKYFKIFNLNPRDYLGDGSNIAKFQQLIKIMCTSLAPRAIASIAVVVGASATEEGLKMIPVIGTAIGMVLGSGVSFTTTCVILGHLIDFCEMEALKNIKST
ncbi:hypothetical protein I4U23_007741 [Adineta vaga]|nr:hypothetical protein I4U23_007741 [Adineta vaga]